MHFYGHDPITITPEILAAMSDEDFFDLMPDFPRCIHCKHCGKPTCKRFNEKSGLKPYHPWFACDTTGYQSALVCKDIDLKKSTMPAISADEFRMLTNEYIKRDALLYVSVFKDGDTDKLYVVPFGRYYHGGMFSPKGELLYKCVKYYKTDRKSPIGYRLVTEEGNV